VLAGAAGISLSRVVMLGMLSKHGRRSVQRGTVSARKKPPVRVDWRP